MNTNKLTKNLTFFAAKFENIHSSTEQEQNSLARERFLNFAGIFPEILSYRYTGGMQMEHINSQRFKPFGVAAGLVISCAVTAFLLLILALLLLKLNLDEEKINVGIILVYILSAFLGGWVTGKKSGSRKFLWGMLTGCFYFIILLAVSLLNAAGDISPGRVITTLAMCLGGGMLGGMLA